MVLSSDGIVEAHGPAGEMFGFGRVQGTIGSAADEDVIGHLLEGFSGFVGPNHEPEDDVTLVSIRRTAGAAASAAVFAGTTVLDEFTMPSSPGNERAVMDRVAVAVEAFGFESARLDRLKTAVAETAMNAIEHGNGSDPALEVGVRVSAAGDQVTVAITDSGGDLEIPDAVTPDIEAKLAGAQTPRGWGLFLIERMVDEVRTTSDGHRRTVELVMGRGDS